MDRRSGGHRKVMKLSLIEHALVINLDHRTDRWQRMANNLAAVGLVAGRFPAVGIGDLSEDLPPAALREFLQQVDGVGQVSEHKLQSTWACMRSHLGVIRLARDAGWPAVLILEDDCEFEPYTSVVLSRALQQLQGRPWDMLYLGGTLKKHSRRTPVSENLLSVDRVRLAHAYIVNSSIYERILLEAPGSGLPLDWYYSERLLPQITAFMVRPTLACQRQHDLSDIEQVARKPKFKTRQMLQRWLAMLRYHRLFRGHAKG